MRKNIAVNGEKRRTLSEQRYEVIQAHILDPENSPLPANQQEQFNRVVQAAQLLDSLHPINVMQRILAKYSVNRKTAQQDVALAQELFKSRFTFDWDYWQTWQIKDLVETIKKCKEQGKFKERIVAHKVLASIIGEKQLGEEDPKRMEKNIFNIQLNNNGTIVNIPLDQIKGLSGAELQTVIEGITATPPQSDAQIIEILDT